MLYKYLPPDRTTYLSNQLLRFTQPGDLNDPFECIPGIVDVKPLAFVEAILERRKSTIKGQLSRKQREKRLPLAKAELVEKFKKDPDYVPRLLLDRLLLRSNELLGVLSLSEIWDSTLMWSHYTLSHSGFCVGFDPQHPFFTRKLKDRPDVGQLTPVDYQTDRMPIDITKKIELPPSTLYRKSQHWAYEREVRLVRELQFATKTVKRTGQLDLCLFEIPHSAVGELICGANATDELKTTVLEAGGKLGVPVWQAIISRKTFDMERKKLAAPIKSGTKK